MLLCLFLDPEKQDTGKVQLHLTADSAAATADVGTSPNKVQLGAMATQTG